MEIEKLTLNENEREKRTSMPDKTIYLKMDAKIKLRGDVVRIGDLGKVYCEETKGRYKSYFYIVQPSWF